MLCIAAPKIFVFSNWQALGRMCLLFTVVGHTKWSQAQWQEARCFWQGLKLAHWLMPFGRGLSLSCLTLPQFLKMYAKLALVFPNMVAGEGCFVKSWTIRNFFWIYIKHKDASCPLSRPPVRRTSSQLGCGLNLQISTGSGWLVNGSLSFGAVGGVFSVFFF